MTTVAVDAQIADVSRAGIGQFTRELLAALPRAEPSLRFQPLRPTRSKDFSMPERWWWDQVTVPRLAQAAGAALLLKPAFSAPVRSSLPTVIVAHDLAARRFPEQLHRPSAWFFGRWVPWTYRRAARIIAASDFTAAELRTMLGIPSERIAVVYQGGDPLARPDQQPQDDDLRRRYRLPQRFIIHVGTIEPRKNLAFLVRVFARLRQNDPDLGLVLAGQPGWRSDDVRQTVERLRLEQAVHFTGQINDDDRRSLERQARALVFPSTYEGFGRPLLEAMASGTPVVAAANSATPEIVGDAGTVVVGYDEGVWASAIERVIVDGPDREAVRSAGLVRSARFTWDRTARAVADVVLEVLRDRR